MDVGVAQVAIKHVRALQENASASPTSRALHRVTKSVRPRVRVCPDRLSSLDASAILPLVGVTAPEQARDVNALPLIADVVVMTLLYNAIVPLGTAAVLGQTRSRHVVPVKQVLGCVNVFLCKQTIAAVSLLADVQTTPFLLNACVLVSTMVVTPIGSWTKHVSASQKGRAAFHHTPLALQPHGHAAASLVSPRAYV